MPERICLELPGKAGCRRESVWSCREKPDDASFTQNGLTVFSSFVKIEKREKGVTGQKWFTFSSVQLPENGGSESDETARLLL